MGESEDAIVAPLWESISNNIALAEDERIKEAYGWTEHGLDSPVDIKKELQKQYERDNRQSLSKSKKK